MCRGTPGRVKSGSAAGVAEAAAAAVRTVELVDHDERGLLDRLDDELRDAVAALHLVGSSGSVLTSSTLSSSR